MFNGFVRASKGAGTEVESGIFGMEEFAEGEADAGGGACYYVDLCRFSLCLLMEEMEGGLERATLLERSGRSFSVNVGEGGKI